MQKFSRYHKETTNKVIRNEIQFQDNRLLTTKIKNHIKDQRKKLGDTKLQEVTKKHPAKQNKDQLKHRRRIEGLFS